MKRNKEETETIEMCHKILAHLGNTSKTNYVKIDDVKIDLLIGNKSKLFDKAMAILSATATIDCCGNSIRLSKKYTVYSYLIHNIKRR